MNFKSTSIVFIIICLIVGMGFYFNIMPWWIILILLFLYINRLVFGAIYIQQNFFIHSINHLDTSHQTEEDSKLICLTFDDGIHPDRTEQVLDILKEEKVPAMFFLIGKNIPHNEKTVLRMFHEGHVIGNHSEEHSWWFDMKSSVAMLEEMNLMNQHIVRIAGPKCKPIYFRPPYGVTNPNLAKAIIKSGMKSVGWNLRSMDTVAKSKDELLSKLKKGTKPGAIVLLHDRCEITVETLTEYITFCKEQGYTFTTL